tara:strand:- start:27781 stop:28212 length:432 start_codon:yes stop_codon:yes gene_type:complete
MIFRALTVQDKTVIQSVLDSRRDLSIVGVSWTLDSIIEELGVSESLGFFQDDLKSFIVFKDLGMVIEILLIYSHKDHQGSAAQVFKALVDAYSHFDEIWLEVHEDNTSAIRFYKQQGFVEVSRRRNYYPDGKAALNYNLRLKR